MTTWTKEKLENMPCADRRTLYNNAQRLNTPEAEKIIGLILEVDRFVGSDDNVNLDDPLIRRIYDIVVSSEGTAACIKATEEGWPALAGVDKLIRAELGNQYTALNSTTNKAGWLVSELMRSKGYKAAGKKKAMPEGCTARTAELWIRR